MNARLFVFEGALFGLAMGCAIGFAVVVSRIGAGAPTNEARAEVPVALELAQQFTAALNAHDVDTVVGLFTEEDAGATLTADRYAWQKYEIRLWAEKQALENIRADAYDFRVTETGAMWNADLYRDDFHSHGIESVAVTNAIVVHDDKLTYFTSRLRDPQDAELLGALWRDGTSPERPAMAASPADSAAAARSKA